MARRTKQQDAEYVWVHYGINGDTGEVESVWQQRDGTLVLTKSDMRTVRAPTGPGRSAQNELVVVFGLSDVFSVPINLHDSEGTKRQIAELEAKAATKRANMKIDYTVHAIVEGTDPKGQYSRGGKVSEGKLSDMIPIAMDCIKKGYVGVVVLMNGRTWRPDRIKEVSERADFP